MRQENELQRFWLVSDPPELWAIKGTGFQQGNIRDGQTFQGHATQHESFGTYAKPSEKRAKKGFKKIS